jgi:hypothetical protein
LLTSHLHEPGLVLRTLAVFAVAFCQGLLAQAPQVEARVASLAGSVLLSGNSRTLQALSRGDALSPGDEIDTRGGGRLTIVLSDGSLVLVLPGSRVILKDYSSASTVRELFDIVLGRVRVKINHYGGRPNPYRINSPTASIAVRGTEFTVSVDAPGDTQVIVYEGLVEVTSLADPSKRMLVEPGRGVIVRPNQDMRIFVPAPGWDIAERGFGERDDRNVENVRSNGANPGGDRDDDSPRNSAGTYERYIASLVDTGQTPLLLRFSAFPDSHLDSLENPSYATEFNAAEGRIFVLPSFSGTRSLESSSADFAGGPGRPIDYSISPQVSFFSPMPDGRTVIGGSLAASRSGLQTFILDDAAALSSAMFAAGTTGQQTTSSSTATTFVTGSFVAAHRFGSTERTSIGFGLDQVSGRGSFSNLLTQSDGLGVISRESTQSQSTIGQTQFKIGISHLLSGNHKLGLFYRYGFVSASDGDRSHTLNGLPQTLDSRNSSGHSSEIGLRLRGPLTRKLFYGLQASWLGLWLDDRLLRAASVDSHQTDNISRAAFGVGLGYAFRPRVVLSFDVAGGFTRSKNLRTEDATRNLLEDKRQGGHFTSVHAALQADVWRQLFVSGSLLVARQSFSSTFTLYPDRFGRLTSSGLFSPNGIASDRAMSYYSEFGLGWRFTPQFLAQYVISTDYGFSTPSHTLLLRYTFRIGEK